MSSENLQLKSDQIKYLDIIRTTGVVPTDLSRPNFNGLSETIGIIEKTATDSRGNTIVIESTIEILAKNDVKLAELTKKEEAINPVEVEIINDESLYPPLPDNALLPYVEMKDVSPWLAEYISYSKKASPEGPGDSHLACALFVLSTVAARRIRIPLSTPQFTPLTIVMCARTSLFAKSSTAYPATKLIKAAGLGFLMGADETTPQKLLYDMAGHVPANYGELELDKQSVLKKRLATSGQRGWYYDEFNQLIDAMSKKGGGTMSDFAGLLRKLDNCPDEYTYATKGGGEDTIEKPYLSLLASTTPANMARHMRQGAELWGDGTCARWLFVCPQPDSFITATMGLGEVEAPQLLAQKLLAFHNHLGMPEIDIIPNFSEKGDPTGTYKASREALPEVRINVKRDAFDAYARYREALRAMVALSGNVDMDGSYTRLPTFALRVAGLLAALENNDVIDIKVWTVAQQIMEIFRANLHEAYKQTASDQVEDSPIEDMMIEHLKSSSKQGLTVREIVQAGPNKLRRLKTNGVRDVLISLERSGVVSCKREGKKECYSLCN